MIYNKIGFHARSMDEFLKVIDIEGTNLVELKPHDFKKNGTEIYTFDGKRFVINSKVAEEISKLCEDREVEVQIHVTPERKNNPFIDMGLCQAVPEHHDLILARYKMLGEMLCKYELGTVLTTHPPSFRFYKKQICSEEEALKIGTELYAKLDQLIKTQGFLFKVGVENVVAPKDPGAALGYKPEHIDTLLGNTSVIGITIDSGHRNLNDEMSIAKLISYGNVVNAHFHTNAGEVSDKDYRDDQHALATPDNFKYYSRYIDSFRRRGLPIILEVEDLDKPTSEELGRYVMTLRKHIKHGLEK